jgi:ribosome-associated translation inhibitor RaiA
MHSVEIISCSNHSRLVSPSKVENGHTAEVVTTLKGTTFRVAEDSPDMYASIDLVASRLVSKVSNIG